MVFGPSEVLNPVGSIALKFEIYNFLQRIPRGANKHSAAPEHIGGYPQICAHRFSRTAMKLSALSVMRPQVLSRQERFSGVSYTFVRRRLRQPALLQRETVLCGGANAEGSILHDTSRQHWVHGDANDRSPPLTSDSVPCKLPDSNRDRDRRLEFPKMRPIRSRNKGSIDCFRSHDPGEL